MKKLNSFRVLLGAAAFAILLVAARSHAAPGDLYVADSGSGTIFKFTPAGIKSTFASGLSVPAGQGFDREGSLLVVERDTGTVLKFASDGSKSTFVSGLSLPFALAFDGLGNLFVTESTGDVGSISKFTPAGLKSTFASGGNFPFLAFDILGNLFAEHGGPTDFVGGITKFTPDGNASDFAFAAGPGLAFSSSGNLFAGDRSGSGGILEFTPAGSRTVFTTAVESSNGLAFDDAGDLFVLDNSGSILKFTPDATKSTFASGLIAAIYLAFEPVVEKLRNISARGLAGTGDNVLIGGFIVGGSALANNTVVTRAIGPSLASAGVTDPLADPILELHNASGEIVATNDNWRDTQEAQITASGLAPADPKESAIFATLPAGSFTAVVRGAGDTTGVALVEVYSIAQ